MKINKNKNIKNAISCQSTPDQRSPDLHSVIRATLTGAQELCSSWGGRIPALDLGQVGLRGISQGNIPVRS